MLCSKSYNSHSIDVYVPVKYLDMLGMSTVYIGLKKSKDLIGGHYV